MADDRLIVDPAIDIVAKPGHVRFLSPDGGFAMRDPAGIAARVTAQCQAGMPTEAILASYGTSDEREAASELLTLLKARKILTCEPISAEHSPDPAREWLRHYGAKPNVDLPPVEIRGDGALASALTRKLREVGAIQPTAAAPQCIVAAYDTPNLTALRELNVVARNTGVAFLPVWLDRSTILWGPMTVPCATGCLECMLHRQQANRRRADPLEMMDMPGLSSSSILADLAAGLASAEVLRWALDAHVDTELGVAWRFDWLSTRMSGSRVLRLPRCPVCGINQDVAP